MTLQLSDNIKRLRREKNLTQDDIATELCISCQAVSRCETGLSYPDVNLLPSLAAILGVSMDVLFGTDENSVERKYQQYHRECDVLTDVDEKIKLTKSYISELPANAYLKYCLISLYKQKGAEFAGGRLDEIRKLCRFVIDHATDMDWWRDYAINDMISMETEDNLNVCFRRLTTGRLSIQTKR